MNLLNFASKSYCFIVVFLCSSLSFGQDTSSRLTKSRSTLPNFAAVYEESLEVPNSKPPEEDEKKVSWGESNAKRFLLCGFGSKTSFVKEISGPDALETTDHQSMTYLAKEGEKNYVSTSNNTQGTFGARPSGMINPAGRHFEIRVGETWSALLGKMERTKSDTAEEYKHEGETVTISLESQDSQVCVKSGSSAFESIKINWEVSDWQKVGSAIFPKTMTETRFRDGVLFQTLTYTLLKVVQSPQKYTKLPEWKQGALVTDTDTSTVYVYNNGKLMIDPRFSSARKGELMTVRILIMLAFVSVGALILWLFLKKTRAKTIKAIPQS